MTKENQKKRHKRAIRIRAKIHGTKSRPRLSVFRSNRYIYGQIIDDISSSTKVAATDKEIKIFQKEKISKLKKARQVGLILSQKAKEKKIKTVVFDRNGFPYKGRIKAFAEGAREGGLKF